MPRSAGASACAPCCWWRPRSSYGVNRNAAIHAGCAVEAIHAYSLIHDDLPCMDDDACATASRPCTRAFDEATAVLAGDCLHALAFDILTQLDTSADPFVRSELVAALARASGHDGMAGGQMMDIVSRGQRITIFARSPGCSSSRPGHCLQPASRWARVLGRVPPEGRAHLRAYARDIGLAFQIADDLLDVEGDEAKAGKALRKDEGPGQGRPS